MNRESFLKQLEAGLKKMPRKDVEDILSDFREYFECAAAGESEDALCARLGDPKKIAREYWAQRCIEDANAQKTPKTMARAFLSSAGLGVVNFFYTVIVVVVGYIVLGSLFFAVCVAGLSGLGVLGASIFFAAAIGAYALWLGIFAGMGVACMSVLGFIGLMKTGNLFRRANMTFLNSISRGIGRRSGDE